MMILQQIKTVASVECFLTGKCFLHPHESSVDGEVGVRHGSWLLILYSGTNLIGEARGPFSDLYQSVNLAGSVIRVIDGVLGSP